MNRDEAIRLGGRYPTRALNNNVISSFENINPSYLIEHVSHVSSGLVQRGLVFCIDSDRFFPFVNLDTKEIVVPDRFGAYVWACSYGLFVYFEEFQKNLAQSGRLAGRPIPANTKITGALELLQFSMQLIGKESEWDVSRLPNPERPKDGDKYYVEKCNALFQDQMAIFLFHELGHLIFRHNKDVDDPDAIQQENDSDNFSMSTVFNGIEDNQQAIQRSFALILASLTMLFPSAISPGRHPTPDDRILRAYSHIEHFLPKLHHPYVWGFGVLSLKLFLGRVFGRTFGDPLRDPKKEFDQLLTVFDGLRR